MSRLKESLWSQMKTMEADLRKDPFPKLTLQKGLGDAETEWNEIKDYHRHILALTEGKQAKDERLAHVEFQTRYIDLNGRVEDALDDHRLEEEARERDQLKVSKVRQLDDRWEAAYLHIDTVLGELKTWLGGGKHR